MLSFKSNLTIWLVAHGIVRTIKNWFKTKHKFILFAIYELIFLTFLKGWKCKSMKFLFQEITENIVLQVCVYYRFSKNFEFLAILDSFWNKEFVTEIDCLSKSVYRFSLTWTTVKITMIVCDNKSLQSDFNTLSGSIENFLKAFKYF